MSQIIYENPLACPADVQNFRLEGQAHITFPNGRLRMENKLDPSEGQRSNYVFWCDRELPASVRISWDFYPIREPGLAMVFFAAAGIDGRDLFDPTLAERQGVYDSYHSGDINTYHIAYFRRRYPEERAFHVCNLRKSRGFHLVAQGADPIPDVADATPPYRIAVEQQEDRIAFFINDLCLFRFTDDGKQFGPVLQGGKVGFRQMAPMIGEYANLTVELL